VGFSTTSSAIRTPPVTARRSRNNAAIGHPPTSRRLSDRAPCWELAASAELGDLPWSRGRAGAPATMADWSATAKAQAQAALGSFRVGEGGMGWALPPRARQGIG
jgi:hypothetical protein